MEHECNAWLTYNRQVSKLPIDRLNALHQRLYAPPPALKPIAPMRPADEAEPAQPDAKKRVQCALTIEKVPQRPVVCASGAGSAKLHVNGQLIKHFGDRPRQGYAWVSMALLTSQSMKALHPGSNVITLELSAPSSAPCEPLPEVLRKAGYPPACFGKTHWLATTCLTRGFEVRYASTDPEEAAILMSQVPEADHRDGCAFNRCLQFLDKGLHVKRPLFLYLPFFKPPAVYNVPAGFEEIDDLDAMPAPEQPSLEQVEPCHARGANREMIDRSFWNQPTKQQWQQMILRYRANCSCIDSMVARVMDQLRARGVLDNCLTVYVSDHGDMLGDRCHTFDRYCVFEHSVRVPLTLTGSASSNEKKGTVDHRPAVLVDILPTILEMAGIPTISGTPGHNLLGSTSRKASVCESNDQPTAVSLMWPTSERKLILTFPTASLQKSNVRIADVTAGELHDLKTDAKEWNNLYAKAEHRAQWERMRDELMTHLDRVALKKVNPSKRTRGAKPMNRPRIPRTTLKPRTSILLTLAALLVAPLARLDAAEDKPTQTSLTAAPTPEAGLTREQRIQWWREARFGMFIHWGLYSIPAGVWKDKIHATGYSEWIMFAEKIPAREYELLAARFNPVRFDAKAWAAIAKTAGMKYMVVTTKHHDGFSMFRSRLTPYNVADATPFKRDVTRELSDACRDSGLRFGCYYSIDRDWYRPQGPGTNYRQNNVWDFPDSRKQDFDRYFEKFAKPQVQELLANYRPDLLWFDDIDMKSDAQVEDLYRAIRKLRPECVLNSRIKGCRFPSRIPPPHCDYISTGDNEIADKALGFEWENPGSMNTSYGYNQNDHNWVDAKEIVFRLVDIVSKGGNYLLNVGPTSEGLIPQPSIDRLMEVGAWMDTNQEAIYGTSPWKVFHDGPLWGHEAPKAGEKSTGFPVDIRFTAKGHSTYAICLAWPEKEVVVRALGSRAVPDKTIAAVSMLGSKDEVKWRQTDDALTLSVPREKPCRYAFVDRIDFKKGMR